MTAVYNIGKESISIDTHDRIYARGYMDAVYDIYKMAILCRDIKEAVEQIRRKIENMEMQIKERFPDKLESSITLEGL